MIDDNGDMASKLGMIHPGKGDEYRQGRLRGGHHRRHKADALIPPGDRPEHGRDPPSRQAPSDLR